MDRPNFLLLLDVHLEINEKYLVLGIQEYQPNCEPQHQKTEFQQRTFDGSQGVLSHSFTVITPNTYVPPSAISLCKTGKLIAVMQELEERIYVHIKNVSNNQLIYTVPKSWTIMEPESLCGREYPWGWVGKTFYFSQLI